MEFSFKIEVCTSTYDVYYKIVKQQTITKTLDKVLEKYNPNNIKKLTLQKLSF